MTKIFVDSSPPTDEQTWFELKHSTWNDWWRWETTYTVTLVNAGRRAVIGSTKIGAFGQVESTAKVPTEFYQLPDNLFSVGQREDFYEDLVKFAGPDVALQFLDSMNDFVRRPDLLDAAGSEAVVIESLLRDVSIENIKNRYSRIVRGDAELTPFSFSCQFGGEGSQTLLSFEVVPSSVPATNIHVLIGRNGVGKSTAIRGITRAAFSGDGVFQDKHTRMTLVRTQDKEWNFAGIVLVTFSAFDPFVGVEPQESDKAGLRFAYVGLPYLKERETETVQGILPSRSETSEKNVSLKDHKQLQNEFIAAMKQCRAPSMRERWKGMLALLEGDPLFKSANISGLASSDLSDWVIPAQRLFERLSSGHKIVLLTITKIVTAVEERSLVLLDEPEAHLHPPLLAAFIRALSHLLTLKNAVAIVTTHSPVVLQEVPARCAWILSRVGQRLSADRPRLETFGENVGTLTREVFQLELSHSGFYALVREVLHQNGNDYDATVAAFNGQLGAEARALIHAEISAAEDED